MSAVAPVDPTRPQTIADALTSARLSWVTEAQLQTAIRAALWLDAGVDPAPEVVLSPGNRIDFMVGSIGIEVKIAGTWREVADQLERYAEHDAISHLILATTRPKHAAYLPPEIGGKPLLVALIQGAAW